VPIRVFLLDDHEVVRAGVRGLLEAEDDLEVVGEASTAAEALTRIPLCHPDVAVLDVRLPDGDGITVCREIRSDMPELACLMLTSFADDEALLGAIRQVAAGTSLLDPASTRRLIERLRAGPTEDKRLAGLTPQERRILDLIAEGRTNRQIGEVMFLAEKTVKNYVSHLLAKLGMARRSEAAAFAARLSEQRRHR
jgi:two-component system response regulator DevR